MPVLTPIDKYNTLTRVDEYFSITESVFKRFKFKITEPTFLSFFTNFEKEISGGSISLSISHSEGEDNKEKSIPTFYNRMTADGVSFIHHVLEPGLSGDVRLNHAGEYIVTVSGGHKAMLTDTLRVNKHVPKCSKVSMFYQLSKISELNQAFDEEYENEIGEIDSSRNNCKNVKIHELVEVQRRIESKRGSNYMDINANILIPDPTSKRRLSLAIRSSSKPMSDVVRITTSLPDEIRKISSIKYNLRVMQINDKDKDDFILHESSTLHEKDISFTVDNTFLNYVIILEFEDVDFELLQTHCSYLQLRIAREPLFNVVALLSQFDLNSDNYKDLDTLKNKPATLNIDKQRRYKMSFFMTPSSLKAQKNIILGKAIIDVQLDQVQLDLFSEFNYISTSISLELVGKQKYKDSSNIEIDGEEYDSNEMYTGRSAIRMIGTGNVLQKGKYELYIKKSDYTTKINQAIDDAEFTNKLVENIKFPFTVKVHSALVNEDLTTKDQKLKLIDIEYNSDPDDDGKYVSIDKNLQVMLEFNDNLDNSKISYENLAILTLNKKHQKGVSNQKIVIEPKKISKVPTKAQNALLIIFSGSNLLINAKYKLSFDPGIEVSQELIDSDILTIKTLSTSCNSKGVLPSRTKTDGS